jgi:DNA-binding transcriptional LysR family regulator
VFVAWPSGIRAIASREPEDAVTAVRAG